MKKFTREEILAEALEIGKALESKAVKSSGGWYWETRLKGKRGKISVEAEADIYSGSSGIALFFLELFRATGRNSFLEAGKGALKWSMERARTRGWDDYSFYKGRAGAAYAAIRIYKTTGEKRYLRQTEEMMRGSTRFLTKAPACDLLTGAAGTILGLLHLHTEVRQEWILKEARDHFDYLLDRVSFGERRGIYWDRSGENIRGLCGLAHGASGVSFVIREMGRYFKNTAYLWLADQAVAYEDSFYDGRRRNWPDFRKLTGGDRYVKEAIAAYKRGDSRYFTRPRFMRAWCHGAPGMVLARQGRPKNWDAGETKLQAGLCHGEGGLTEIRRLLGRETDIGRLAGRWRELEGTADLFCGQAGVGYALVKSLDPEGDSILYPRLEREFEPNGRFSEDKPALMVRLAKKLLEDTWRACTYKEKRVWAKAGDQEGGDLAGSLTQMADLAVGRRSKARMVFNAEKLKRKLDYKYSDVYLGVAEYMRRRENEKLLALPDEDLARVKLRLVREVCCDKGFIFRQTAEGVKMAPIGRRLRKFIDKCVKTEAVGETTALAREMLKLGLAAKWILSVASLAGAVIAASRTGLRFHAFNAFDFQSSQ